MAEFWSRFDLNKFKVEESDTQVKDPIVEVQNSKKKPVIFSIRTNCNFVASSAFSPNKDLTLSFQPLNYFHVLSIYSSEWWIAYQIIENASIGFIPR
ncbi:hypothetical protein HZS_8074 [Henneguya salminicola]|nr:hypothetical protein HZS_8074 [Henneguya salminicola]